MSPMRIRRETPITLAIALTACAVTPIQRDRAVSRDVVVSNAMCGTHGTVSASNDAKGERMLCGWEEFTGSHVPKCICRDEQGIIEEREQTQDWLRTNEHQCQAEPSARCKL